MFVVFDLDGTLSDASHRLHYIKGDKKNWDQFYAQCVADGPIWPMIHTSAAFYRQGNIKVEIWTGRSDVVREETEKWLVKYGVQYHNLRMRPDGDYRPDVELKHAWLEDSAVTGFPNLVFEDRPGMVDMYRSNGIMCCQVHEWDEEVGA